MQRTHFLVSGRFNHLESNDFRQIIRIVVAGCMALIISSWLQTSYGVFFVIYPIMLLSLVPHFNHQIALQMIFNSIVNCIEMIIAVGCLTYYPTVMSCAVFMFYVMRFRCMSRGGLYLYGSMGVICLSVMLNFMSYPTTNYQDILVDNFLASVLAVMLAALMYFLFPDLTVRIPLPKLTKDIARIRHETLLGAIVATCVFLIFQSAELSDSLSALVACVLTLFPMHYRGAVVASGWRVAGVLLGCIYGLAVQLVIYDYTEHLFLIMPLITVGLMLGAFVHVVEKVGSGVGFAILSTVGLMFGQYMEPHQDIVFTDVYRFTSVAVALCGTLILTFLIHKVLNQFSTTCYSPDLGP